MTESSPTGLRKLYEKLILHFRALRAMGKDPMNGQLTTTEMCLALSQRAMLPEMNKKWEEYGKIYGPLLTTIDSRIHLMNVDAITVYGNEEAARRLRNFASNIAVPNTADDPCENLIQVGTVLIERERRRIIKKLLKRVVKSAERNKRRGNRGMRTCNRMLRI
ncbi:hypothetical protein T4A_2801, partial [Trichinella pseudospiralis]